MSVELTETKEGVLFRVRVSPGTRQTKISGLHHGMLKIQISQAPEKGKANKAVVQLLARTFGVNNSQIDIVSGHTSQSKVILMRGLSLSAIAAKINEIASGTY